MTADVSVNQWNPLEVAAEATIAAATAALVWEGQDSYGVLERVAGATAKGMATARIAAEIMADVTTSVQFTAIDEDARGGAVAGLPGWLAPRWAATAGGTGAGGREAAIRGVSEASFLRPLRTKP